MKVASSIRLNLLASALALAVAAPSAFADSGKTVGNTHIDPGSSPDGGGGAVHSQEVMKQRVTPSGSKPDTGRWVGNTHIDPGATPDGGGGATHSRQTMDRRIAPSNMQGAGPLPSAAY